MPAEWEPHRSTWLTWPANKITFPSNLLVNDKEIAHAVLKPLAVQKTNTSNLIFHKVNAVDAWIRDYGPIFIKKDKGRKTKDEEAFVKWEFNAWGGKYS